MSIGMLCYGIVMQFSPIMVREISSKTNLEMLASPSTDKYKISSQKSIENVTVTDDERYKRILPYLEFYSQKAPIEDHRMLTVAQYNEGNPKIHFVVPIEPGKRYKNPQSNRQKQQKEIFVQFTKYNAQPGPFVPIAKKPPPPPPNFSEIYDKLSQLKMLQLNSLEAPTYTRIKSIKPLAPRPFVSIQAIGNLGKGPPINHDRNKPAKTIIYVPPTPLRNDYFQTNPNEFYPVQVQENKKHQNDYYDSFKESALTHNNNQYFYEHPIVVKDNPQSTYVPIKVNQQHGTTGYEHQSYYDPQLSDYYIQQEPHQQPKYELINRNVNHPTAPIVYEDEYRNDYDDMAENPSKIYPILEYGTKHQKQEQTTPKVTSISSTIRPKLQKESNNQQTTDSIVPVPPKLVEIISQNTMKYYQNTPSSADSVPNLSEETAKKNSLNTGLTMVPNYQSPTNHKEDPEVNVLDYDRSSESDYKNSVDSSESDSSLNSLLKKLQETNTLPKTFTVENIDNSIKTLVHILSSLKKHKKLLQPVVSNDNDQYDDIENEAEGPISSENFPGDTPEGGTPGRPGIDYPALSAIPHTSFDCNTQRYKGFFADPETQCQVWHYCDLNGGQASFLCPNGTTFSQVALTCDWWYNVKCANTPQLYVLNERLYKYIIPLTPKFPEDYSGPLVDKYLAIKFKEMEEKMKKQKKGKKPSEQKADSEEETTSSEETDPLTKDKKEDGSIDPSIVTLSEVNQ
ncbi:uncharacterized protein LOC108738644 isoform X2 [Agrilus planipennis]|uniref:Uncharacterized protein LOC108738644 isoform X2 n=1 Tax=Agrilus planipennis TaxID=224129 RepID=A0A7F5RME8_AGRPL|nr:uncharacterized protein LOC108738644 isoform X2 [Agrilus planipennis]